MLNSDQATPAALLPESFGLSGETPSEGHTDASGEQRSHVHNLTLESQDVNHATRAMPAKTNARGPAAVDRRISIGC